MHEVSKSISDAGVVRASAPFRYLFLLGVLAGTYIAFAAYTSSVATFGLWDDPSTRGLARFLAGTIFPGGLILIIVAGGELFTGNTMMLLPLAERRITLAGLLRNWVIVYLGNFIGAAFIAWMIFCSGQFNTGNHLFGGITIRIAAAKCDLTFCEALILGILCNWLVCLAITMATKAQDVAGKILAIFFPIWIFITAGFEHSIANMYYVPAGLLAASNPSWLEAANLSPEALASLTGTNFLYANLLPVTLGNIIGGGGFVALAYGWAIGPAESR